MYLRQFFQTEPLSLLVKNPVLCHKYLQEELPGFLDFAPTDFLRELNSGKWHIPVVFSPGAARS
jgi:hypothetical protein